MHELDGDVLRVGTGPAVSENDQFSTFVESSGHGMTGSGHVVGVRQDLIDGFDTTFKQAIDRFVHTAVRGR
nr:hypothetical protein [Actinopolyspora alba]